MISADDILSNILPILSLNYQILVTSDILIRK